MAEWAMECVVFSSGGDWKIEDSNFIRFGVFECCNFAALNGVDADREWDEYETKWA